MHEAWRQVASFRIDNVTSELQVGDLGALDPFLVPNVREHTIAFILCYYFEIILIIAAVEVIFNLRAFPVACNAKQLYKQ